MGFSFRRSAFCFSFRRSASECTEGRSASSLMMVNPCKRECVVILWSIQSDQAWKALQSSGVLHTDARYAFEDFTLAYAWMAEQMAKRLPATRPIADALPLWAWYQYDGENKRKPDLSRAGHLPRGERGVRIEFEIDDDLVLLSDFEVWHYVLNYWYLPASMGKDEEFEARLAKQSLSFYTTKPLPDPVLDEEIRTSWERIFDLEWAEKDIAAPRAQKSIQATFWELPLQSVRQADEFVAR